MEFTSELFIFAALGLVVGALIVHAFWLARVGPLRGRVRSESDRVAHLERELELTRNDLEESRDTRERMERECATLGERLESRQREWDRQRVVLESTEDRLKNVFGALGAKALQANNQQFLDLAKSQLEALMTEARSKDEKRQQSFTTLVTPIKELLDKQGAALSELEKKREVAYEGLRKQFEHIAHSHDRLGQETRRLVDALRRPEQRGRWGEMQLKNAVELAGMAQHCDFDEQPSIRVAGDLVRPDMTVRLPGGGRIVVDSKVALDAYVDLIANSESEEVREELLQRHAQQVATHVNQLASKDYGRQLERAGIPNPGMVILFMPLESALVAALEKKPTLHADAMERNVLIATPTLLVALLRAVAFGWQQEKLADNAREIAQAGKELYQRLSGFVTKFEKIGTRLESAGTAYDEAVGSLDRRLLPSARRIKELHGTTQDEISTPNTLQRVSRKISSGELRETDPESPLPTSRPSADSH